jgi:uncharacterized protein YbjT (DUF2867 family)
VGGSGLVGRQLPARIVALRPEAQLDLLLRRPASAMGIDLPPAARVFAGVPLPQALAAWRETAAGCDVFISALGTTRRAAGSLQAFIDTDHGLVLQVAQAARAAGARQAVLVSSVGADPGARNDYLRVKGELERDVAALGFERCDFVQPGLLRGRREGPARPAEALGQWLLPLVDPLLRGRAARYRSVPASCVAAAAAALVGAGGSGVFQHVQPELDRLAAGQA